MSTVEDIIEDQVKRADLDGETKDVVADVLKAAMEGLGEGMSFGDVVSGMKSKLDVELGNDRYIPHKRLQDSK